MTDIFGADTPPAFKDDLIAEATPQSLSDGAKMMKNDYPLLADILMECAIRIEQLEGALVTSVLQGQDEGYHEGYLDGFRYGVEWARVES